MFRWWNVEYRFNTFSIPSCALHELGRLTDSSTGSWRWFGCPGPSFTDGAETHDVEGISINVFAPAKMIADCFKFRGRVPTDTAMEALRSYVRSGVGPADDLYYYADVCSVQAVALLVEINNSDAALRHAPEKIHASGHLGVQDNSAFCTFASTAPC